MNTLQQSGTNEPPVVGRIMGSLAILFTSFLLAVAAVGEFENTARLLAIGFLCITFWIIIGIWIVIQFTESFTSTRPHELRAKRNR